MDADPATLTEPERRVALLDWLARGRDIRIAAELCGEKHDWAKDIAKAAGHPDRDQIRQALAAAKAELHPPRQPLKPDSIAPTRQIGVLFPRRNGRTAARDMASALAEHVAGYADGMAVRRCKVCLGPIDDDGTDRTQCHRCRTVLAIASGAATLPAPAPITDEADEADEQPDPDPAEGPRCPDCGAEDCQVIPYCTPGDVDADEAEAEAEHLADVVEHAIETGEPLLEDPAQCEHQPRLVLEGRLWHAVCPACGTTWHRTRCTAEGCGAYVSAEYIARTGSTRHDWHPKEQS